jgi:hypothetical protein
MSWSPPSVADFKAYFTRDFSYAPSCDNTNDDYILDSDITKALNQAGINFNDSLGFMDQEATIAYLFLTAFYLLVDLQLAQRGLSSQANFPIQSKGVGQVNVAYQIPERYTQDPVVSYYAQNGYGQKYLSIVLPYMVGNVGVIVSETSFD